MNTKRIVRYITIAAIFLVPIFPLIVTTSFVSPFITGKAFYFRILVEIAFAGWVVLTFLDAKYRPKLTSLTVAVTLFILITFIADLFGVSPLRSLWSNLERMEGWITIIHLWAFYIVLTNIFSADEEGKKLWKKWFNFSLIIATIVAFYGLFQLFGWTDFNYNVGRADASFGNESYLAVYLIFHVFIALYLFAFPKAEVIVTKKKVVKKKSFRWIYILLAVLFGIVIYGTQTRGAILGLVGGILLSLILFAIFRKGESKKLRWVVICVVAVVLIGGIVFWLNRDASFIRNNPTLERFASISWNDASNQSRLYVWPMAVRGAMERPVLGWGQENFNYIFQADYNPLMYDQEQWFDRAHNVFLDWLVSSGIIGLLSYLSLYILFFIYVWRSSLNIGEKSVLTGLLAGYTFNNLFIFDNLGSYVLFFAMLAYLNIFRQRVMDTEKSTKRLDTDYSQQDVIQYVVMPVVLIALVFTVYFFNVRQMGVSMDLNTALNSCEGNNPDIMLFQSDLNTNTYMTDQEVREHSYLCSTGIFWNPLVSDETKQAFVDLAKNSIMAQASTTPNDMRGYYFAGSFLNQILQYGEAEKYLIRAHDLSPTKQSVDFELATSYLFQKKNDQALVILKQAYDSAPQYAQAAEAYAMALVIAGKEADARNIPLVDQKLLDTTKSFVLAGQLNKADVLFQGVVNLSQDFNVQLGQAELEYSQGMTQQAIQTLRSIEVGYPGLKDMLETTINQIQAKEIIVPKK